MKKLLKNKRVRKRISPQYNFFPKNRRGDVPVTVLVIGVVAICGLALFSFFNSVSQVRKNFEGVDKIYEMRLEIEKDSLDYSYKEISKNKFKISLTDSWIKEKVVFSVEYNEK